MCSRWQALLTCIQLSAAPAMACAYIGKLGICMQQAESLTQTLAMSEEARGHVECTDMFCCWAQSEAGAGDAGRAAGQVSQSMNWSISMCAACCSKKPSFKLDVVRRTPLELAEKFDCWHAVRSWGRCCEASRLGGSAAACSGTSPSARPAAASRRPL